MEEFDSLTKQVCEVQGRQAKAAKEKLGGISIAKEHLYESGTYTEHSYSQSPFPCC